ncbi:MAG: DnaD domain protein [Lachnospiraceae bacterium]
MSHLKVMGTGTGYTLISNVFIDQYMITAGSSHVKTYILLMRLLADPLKEISVSGMADILDCSESDVLRSFRHWEKKGLMQLRYEPGSRTLSEIILLDPQEDGSNRTVSAQDGGNNRVQEEMVVSRAPAQPAASVQFAKAAQSVLSGQSALDVQSEERKTSGGQQSGGLTAFGQSGDGQSVAVRSAGGQSAVSQSAAGQCVSAQEEEPLPPHQVDLAAVSADENFSRLLFIAEQYIGSPLSRSDCESFAWMYDALKMDAVLLEYLVESCVSNGHRSVRYMEAVAIDWHRKKIRTVEQARIYTPLHNKNLYAVMKALGLGGRQPAPSEKKIIDSWFQEYGFSLDMVVEACNRTMISIHEPNLNYVESILSRWKKAGISRLDQIQGLDEKFQKEKEENGKKTAGKGQAGRNGSGKNSGGSGGGSFSGRPTGNKPGAQFHDFEQRDYDYDELLKQINSNN